MSQALLHLTDVHVRYGQALAVNGVTIEVHPGQVTAIVGPNGAGKSSLLKAISGLIPIQQGQMVFSGESIVGLRPKDLALSGIAHVPEGRRIFAKMSVLDNLLLGAYLRQSKDVAPALQSVYAAFPRLQERLGQRAGSMSGGEQQMLAIGRALMSAPRLIMVDEVSQGLAPVVVQEVYRQLKRLSAQGMTVLMVEQNARLAFELATQVYVMEQGCVVAHGPTETVAQSVHVRNAYLGLDAT
ncbi:LivF ABC-type branched-chain amino acid transport systems, ATPase component [Burkholderiaceae bacterium]|jgi:branched-chain amino acid transport system ATP-binding protein